MNLRWVVACAAAEAVGMTAAAGAARGADGLAPLAGFLVVVAGGLVEGTALGLAQSTVLSTRLGRTGRRAWVAVTVLVAGLGWAAGSAPATLAADAGGPAPSLGIVMLGGAALGLAMGALLGGAQATVLRHRVRHPWRWVTANALAWPIAMAVIFAGATTAGPAWSWPVVAGYGALTGAIAGAGLGLVSGSWLAALDGPPLRHRLVLASLAFRRRPARAGWTGLTVTGVRSGRSFSFPVMAAPLRNSSLVVLPGHSQRKTWWRQLDTGNGTGTTIRLLDAGRWVPASARLLDHGDLEWSVARAAYVARWPRARVDAGPLVVVDLTPAEPDEGDEGDESPFTVGPDAVEAALTGP